MIEKIKYNAIFTHKSENKFNWIIKINDESFNYFQGMGHFTSMYKPRKQGYLAIKNKKPENGIYNEKLSGWLHKPTLNDVMYCLLLDSQCGELSFDDFCFDLGYDNDSIKAFDIYRACQETRQKLNKILSRKEIEHFKKILEDY